jgi:hypothetical protein
MVKDENKYANIKNNENNSFESDLEKNFTTSS